MVKWDNADTGPVSLKQKHQDVASYSRPVEVGMTTVYQAIRRMNQLNQIDPYGQHFIKLETR